VLTEHEEIPLKDLPEELYQQPTTRASLWPFSGLSIKANTIALEKDLIEKALKETNRNRTKAARHLEISYPTLLAKMKAYGRYLLWKATLKRSSYFQQLQEQLYARGQQLRQWLPQKGRLPRVGIPGDVWHLSSWEKGPRDFLVKFIERLGVEVVQETSQEKAGSGARNPLQVVQAEITRLQKLVSLADGPVPLLFLLDELLHGTNSHDRRIGAEAVVKALVRRNAIGLLTTHDLSLAHIADLLDPQAANVHFEDHIENGRMVFDYHLHPGVVKKSNALELMRSIGLEV